MKRKYEVAVRQKALIALERDKLLEQVHMSYASVISQEDTNHIFVRKPHFLAYAFETDQLIGLVIKLKMANMSAVFCFISLWKE